MFTRNASRLVTNLTVLILCFFVCSRTKAQQPVTNPKPSDPVALALVQDWLKSFGDDVYHCKWEYDAERTREPNYKDGTNKLHIEGDWSFSATLGSSYTIRYGGIEYIIREVKGGDHKIVALWPEVTKDGQKFSMLVAPFFNNAFRGELLAVRAMFYPCKLRSDVLMDKWGNSCVFGLKSSDSEKTVIAIEPLRKDFEWLITLQTKDGTQAIGETWEVNNSDPRIYKAYLGREHRKDISNVKVNNAWLPVEISFEQLTEEESSGTKSVFETARWRVIGQYTVDKDESKFEDIVPPDGTSLFNELTMQKERIGAWKRTERVPKAN